jgi:hypothetical protein
VTVSTTNALAGLAGRLTDPQDRERYAAILTYLQRLPEEDEFSHLAELLGLLSLMGQRVPDAIAELLIELRSQTGAAKEYYAQIDARLAGLPQEIAAGVDPSAIAKDMSHSFRQQLSQTALHETASLLKAAVITLKSLSTELVTTLQPISVTLSEKTTTLLATLKELNEFEQRAADRGKSHSAITLQALLFFGVFVAGGLAGYLLKVGL